MLCLMMALVIGGRLVDERATGIVGFAPGLYWLAWKFFYASRASAVSRSLEITTERLALDVETPDGVLFGLLAWCKVFSLLILAYLSVEWELLTAPCKILTECAAMPSFSIDESV